jgi:hypothetical protein
MKSCLAASLKPEETFTCWCSVRRLEAKVDIFAKNASVKKKERDWHTTAVEAEKTGLRMAFRCWQIRTGVGTQHGPTSTTWGMPHRDKVVVDEESAALISRMQAAACDHASVWDASRVAEVGERIGAVDAKLERIAGALGMTSSAVARYEQEDRKRLKEKLKLALELKSHKPAVLEREKWLEYIFGICKPDMRNGKQGSRYCTEVKRARFSLF